jgi:hypothetical protein
MPRDGSGNYSQPFPPVVDGTTIESTVYNGYTADVTIDLNTPRPIVAGGTGANNARDARLNIGAEVSSQIVTNYDTQVWENGSFSSAAGATGAPTAGDLFFGSSYILNGNNQNWVRLVASGTNNLSYSRFKYNGVWQPWQQMLVTIADTDARYVDVTGDTMAGGLTINAVSPSLTLNKPSSATATGIYGTSAGVPRWIMQFGDATAETGGNVGSRFIIARCNDAGAFVDAPLSISRNDGRVTLNGSDIMGNTNISGTVRSTVGSTGGYYFGSGSSSLSFDGTSYFLGGGSLSVQAAVIAAGSIRTQETTTSGTVYFGSSTTRNIQMIGDNTFYMNGGNFVLSSPSNAYKAGGGPWIDVSDARTKNILGDYVNGLDAVMELQPVRFSYKGNDTQLTPSSQHMSQEPLTDDNPTVPYANSPHYEAAISNQEFIGLIAQSVEPVMPEMVKQRSGYIDGVYVTDVRELNTGPLIFALINAVKELKAEVDALKAGR